MPDWMNETEDSPLNADAPRLKKKSAPRHDRVMRGLTASEHLFDAFDDLAHSLRKEGVRRPELLDEALTDLLSKYGAPID